MQPSPPNQPHRRHRSHPRRRAIAAVLLPCAIAGALAGARRPEGPTAPAWHRPAGDDTWLDAVNEYRALARLPAVTEDLRLSTGCARHAQYIVKTGSLTHFENPASPVYTAAGDSAARESNLGAGSGALPGQRHTVERFAGSVFHALGVFSPRLRTSGYGEYHESPAPASLAYGYCLNVIRGQTGEPPAGTYPVRFPATNGVQPFLSAPIEGEYPDPRSHCGYTGQVGGIVLLQASTTVAHRTAGTLTRTSDGAVLESCTYDGTSYTNPDAAQQDLGRRVLAGYNAAVLVPKQPLAAGTTYRVKLTVNGADHEWSFTTAAESQANP